MRKLNFSLLQAFLALTLLSPCTTPVTSNTFPKQKIHTTTMADAWIPIRQHGKGRNTANRGGGDRDGRLAPAAVGRGPPPGSPTASRISVHHNVPSPTDILLETFLQVSGNTHTQRITVDVAHDNKVTMASKPRVHAPRPRPNLWLRVNFSIHHNMH
jgi:hypothetical protein